MRDFLINYWRLILEAICVVASLVFCLIRKKPVKVVDTIQQVICRLLPYAITEAEKSDLKGDDKKKFCLDILRQVLCEMDLDFTTEHQRFAGEQLEIILSTPQKKGKVIDEK